MRKREKVRIPQDVVAWKRVTVRDYDEESHVPVSKAKRRQIEGRHRHREADALHMRVRFHAGKPLMRSFLTDSNDEDSSDSEDENGVIDDLKYGRKQSQWHPMGAVFRSKNTCSFFGTSRTYNRKLGMARHTLKRLTRVGMVPGLWRS